MSRVQGVPLVLIWPCPPVVVHGFEWHDADVLQPIGGPVARRAWSVRTLGDEIIAEGGDAVGFGRSRTPLDYFFAVFPQDQLARMVRLTSAKLVQAGVLPTSPGELVKFFGVLLLSTRFEFGSRAELWWTTARTKHLPAPAFGSRTGMPRRRFDLLWSLLTFSQAPDEPPAASGGSEQLRWARVNDFVSSINTHRSSWVTPGDTICVDESISRWYGQGGHWTSRGLPIYVAIDRKPENECEIQDAVCGRSGLTLQLRIVTTAADQQSNLTAEELAGSHGTAVLMRLVRPWAGTDRIVCVDSYFASVATALALKEAGLRFTGVVKTAHRRFPLASLDARELGARGDHLSMVHLDATGRPDMLALVWVERERRYFVPTAGSCQPGTSYERLRWREMEDGTGAHRVALTVRQPEVAQLYYGCCSQIDRHNRCRQEDLRLERKLGTHDWSMRVNISLLGICIADAWLLHRGARGPAASLLQANFYALLASEMIEMIGNTLDATGTRTRAVVDGAEQAASGPAYGVGTHLTPTAKRRHASSGHLVQSECRVCGARTTLVCSTCKDTPGVGEVFFCGARSTRLCFAEHICAAHQMSV